LDCIQIVGMSGLWRFQGVNDVGREPGIEAVVICLVE
jgi:hypothetical protein